MVKTLAGILRDSKFPATDPAAVEKTIAAEVTVMSAVGTAVYNPWSLSISGPRGRIQQACIYELLDGTPTRRCIAALTQRG